MAIRNKDKGEKSELVSFWVNVFVVGIVMVVLGFYLGTYMLDIWKSGDTDTTPDMFTAMDTPDAVGQPEESGAEAMSSSTQSTPDSGLTSTQSLTQSQVSSSESSKPATSGSLYKVRVGSFDDRESAEVMAGKLKREGYSDAWVTSTTPYRVQVGAYSNPDNATKIVKQLESSGYSVHIVN